MPGDTEDEKRGQRYVLDARKQVAFFDRVALTGMAKFAARILHLL
jgi:hypothetical protein